MQRPKLSMNELGRKTIEQYQHAAKTPFIVVLDNVRSQNNIGSVFRTSDAFLVESIFLCGITSTPPQREIHKTALGAENAVPWKYFANTLEAVKELHQQGYVVFAIEQAVNSIFLSNVCIDKNKKYALVFGNEIKGVDQQVVDICDGCIEIPQFGTKHSFNIAVSAGIILWELFNRFNQK